MVDKIRLGNLWLAGKDKPNNSQSQSALHMIPLQIRPGDVDSLGHVNNSTYVAYLMQALAEFLAQHGFGADWNVSGQHRWIIHDLAIEYRLASSFGDRLAADVWLADADPHQPLFGCEIFRRDAGNQPVIVRAQVGCRRWEPVAGQAVALDATRLREMSSGSGERPRTFKAPSNPGSVRSYQWRHRVERAEVGLDARVHPHVVFEWVEESITNASATAGWPIERYLSNNFVVLQMRHDAHFHSQPMLGDDIEIISSLVEVRRLRGTWRNEIRNSADGHICLVNYSTGIFLNLSGRPTSPPPGLMEALQTPLDEGGTR